MKKESRRENKRKERDVRKAKRGMKSRAYRRPERGTLLQVDEDHEAFSCFLLLVARAKRERSYPSEQNRQAPSSGSRERGKRTEEKTESKSA